MNMTHQLARSSRMLVMALAVAVLGGTAEDRDDIRNQVGAWSGAETAETAEAEPEAG